MIVTSKMIKKTIALTENFQIFCHLGNYYECEVNQPSIMARKITKKNLQCWSKFWQTQTLPDTSGNIPTEKQDYFKRFSRKIFRPSLQISSLNVWSKFCCFFFFCYTLTIDTLLQRGQMWFWYITLNWGEQMIQLILVD